MAMSQKIVQVPQSKSNLFLQLLARFQKEHARKSKQGVLQFYSIWEYDHARNVAIVYLESKTLNGYILAEYDQFGMIKVLQSPSGNIPSVPIYNEILRSLLGAYDRLVKRAAGTPQGGGGKKKGYYLKHGLGPTSALRLQQALACLEISGDFEREARRLGIGMSYYK